MDLKQHIHQNYTQPLNWLGSGIKQEADMTLHLMTRHFVQSNIFFFLLRGLCKNMFQRLVFVEGAARQVN